LGKSICAMFEALVMGIGLTVSAMAASPCSPGKDGTAGCKNEIAACKATRSAPCAGLTKKAKKTCLRENAVKKCKKDTHLACVADNTVCSASPSGAFLD